MSQESKNKITIHNLKSSGFHQVHADGASAGITPSGYINLNFYSQRNIIPKGTIFELSENGALGNLIGITEDSKEGIIREYEVGAYMDLNTCKSLRDLLDQKINELENLVTPKKP